MTARMFNQLMGAVLSRLDNKENVNSNNVLTDSSNNNTSASRRSRSDRSLSPQRDRDNSSRSLRSVSPPPRGGKSMLHVARNDIRTRHDTAIDLAVFLMENSSVSDVNKLRPISTVPQFAKAWASYLTHLSQVLRVANDGIDIMHDILIYHQRLVEFAANHPQNIEKIVQLDRYVRSEHEHCSRIWKSLFDNTADDQHLRGLLEEVRNHVQHLLPARTFTSRDRSSVSFGHTARRFASTPASNTSVCFRYNGRDEADKVYKRQDFCLAGKEGCRYAHACQNCRGAHPKYQCNVPRNNNTTTSTSSATIAHV